MRYTACVSQNKSNSSIPLRDSKFLRQYYEKVFKNLQQTNCRVIAKVYVKIVEPRKQVQYPYNGRRTVGGITYQMSPEETKPPWWPPGVSHREPDHLSKAERIALLVHILCDLRLSHGITAQKLKVAEQPSRRDAEEKYLEGKTTILVSKANLPDSCSAVNRQHHKSNGHSPGDTRPFHDRISQNSSMSKIPCQVWPARDMNNQHSTTISPYYQESHFYLSAPSSQLVSPQGLPYLAPATVRIPLDFSSFGSIPFQFSLSGTLGDLSDIA
ncbi:hypothetical protein PENANT_c092G10202 [Penicillium antarcticum]|uniref:Subtelomeric hrmA-associated cluster protein AFUB-079030/YDR124W-like helical bundle domain-containing protein n=1 Tax=Penicillium antarcticum TaxID=416450 RepID=A0A1V6PM31_9EURO|nr:hypothetical protein PENANT_c092G10202 [Penicillium antarcticum]